MPDISQLIGADLAVSATGDLLTSTSIALSQERVLRRLMTNPGDYLEAFKKAGADSCTIHIEIGDTAGLIARMREVGLGVGLALNPDADFEAVRPFSADIDLLLCMSVFPGFGGQSFIADVLQTVKAARAEIDERGLPTVVQIDGGIDLQTIGLAAAAGATNFVAGTAVFGQADPGLAVSALRDAAAAAVAA